MGEKMYLTKPNITYANEIMLYRQEFIDANSSLDGCGSLKRMENPSEWLEQAKNSQNVERISKYVVPWTQFIYVRESDKTVVGMIQVRHYFNDFLEKYAGNIGYSVRPSQRKKGYATQMLKEILPYCKEIGLNKVLISCLTDNEASRKVILKNGGAYESTVYEPKGNVYLERYWITLD